jgi:hypothetical protein
MAYRHRLLLITACVVPAAARAQAAPRVDLGGSIEVGGEEERYLRALQIAGLAPLTPWSIQPFSPSQAAALRTIAAPHPWRARFDTTRVSATSTTTGLRAGMLAPKLRLIGNSSFPFQDGSGPTWAGRGVTAEAQGGVAAEWDRLSLQLAPLAFVAQNADFPLAPNGQAGSLRFGDPRFPALIDAPQRFGSGVYARMEPGTSSLTLDVRPVVAGLSTAPQRWGPASDFPLILGPNAGGFPMAFLGTSQPMDLWLFRLHGRVVYGELGQTEFAAPVDGSVHRFASGLVVTLLPRGAAGLEIGASRFIHRTWDGFPNVREIARPFSLSRENLTDENQMASVFARWALPNAHAEFYGELYREDFPGRFHQSLSLVEKPDDLAAFTIGFQHVLTVRGDRITVVRAELVNGETSHQERDERGFTRPSPPYIHGEVTQGHTENGLLLGSPEAYGGAGWRLGLDQFTRTGRRSIALERSLRFDWLPTQPPDSSTAPLVHPDVIYDVRAELLRFDGRREYAVTLIPAVDLNRNLQARHDVLNVLVEISLRAW